MTCRMYDVSHSVIEMFYIKKRSPIRNNDNLSCKGREIDFCKSQITQKITEK